MGLREAVAGELDDQVEHLGGLAAVDAPLFRAADEALAVLGIAPGDPVELRKVPLAPA